MAKASMIPASVEPCLDTFMKTSPGRPSSYSPTCTYPSQSATRNANVFDRRRRGRRSRMGCFTTTVVWFSRAFSSFSTFSASSASWASASDAAALFTVAKGWATLQLSR